ncbi:YcaO-like family protein [Actinoplanes sp. N902-109]|uniref:YcaO-like family protein n=1 Tax=Actinoplanes sp. (strain N902-109) TaxID=649831 RepID=UPI001E3F1DE0|nr:YcaO-like family protein [Actinoplanes sp. N902-109]
MIDIPRTLATSTGVADRMSLIPPHGESPLWSVGVELTAAAGLTVDAIPLSARMVGASGHSRADALLRGAGEAVERFALHPQDGTATVRGTAAALARPTLAAADPGVALAAPESADAELTWVSGRRMRDGRELLVPLPLVDWPAMDAESHLFDPGPSGAAAGSNPRMARRAALLEIVERDAVICAWERGLRLPAYRDLDLIPVHGPDDVRDRAGLAKLWQRALEHGITPGLARIPTAVPGLWSAVGSLVDAPGRGALASVGLKASDRPWAALLGAFQEAWQVRAALQAADPEQPAPGTIVTEHDRIQYMLTRDGYDCIRDWVAGFTGPVVDPEPRRSTDEAVLEAVLADGGDPVEVDLTDRLPLTLRTMGWRATKILPVNYQHLRMDETHRWSWNRPRLATADVRTGCEARYSGCSADRPHPLP